MSSTKCVINGHTPSYPLAMDTSPFVDCLPVENGDFVLLCSVAMGKQGSNIKFDEPLFDLMVDLCYPNLIIEGLLQVTILHFQRLVH